MKALNLQTEVLNSYWKFAAERLAIYYRRLGDSDGPWTDDPILGSYRFTNTFRAADRVSQYLMREVQYRQDRSQAPAEVFFRTILFKIFNKIETWEHIERKVGPISWQSSDLGLICSALDHELKLGRRIYSAAYIMPSPNFGHDRKHANHLALLKNMMDDNLPGQIVRASSMEEVYKLVLKYPGLGPFLAFQYTIDLNYSTLLDFSESEFVVAGPGALDGISKCFHDANKLNPADVIFEVTAQQDTEFERLNLKFDGLFGRKLQPIDCQNLFCEISKYARVAHPDVTGVSGRTRIKQHYKAGRATSFVSPFFPEKWRLELTLPQVEKVKTGHLHQLELF